LADQLAGPFFSYAPNRPIKQSLQLNDPTNSIYKKLSGQTLFWKNSLANYARTNPHTASKIYYNENWNFSGTAVVSSNKFLAIPCIAASERNYSDIQTKEHELLNILVTYKVFTSFSLVHLKRNRERDYLKSLSCCSHMYSLLSAS